MTIIDTILGHAGSWQATYRLWMSPDSDAPLKSPSSAIVSPMVNGKMACIEYTWTVGWEPGGGRDLFIGYENKIAAW